MPGRPEGAGQKRPLLWFSAAFAGAALIIVLCFGEALWRGSLLCAVLTLAALALMLVWPAARRPVILAGFAAGTLWCTGFIALRYLPAAQYHEYTGYLIFSADRYAVGYGEYGVVDGRLVDIDGRAANIAARLYLEDGSPGFAPGDRLSFAGSLSLAGPEVRAGHLANGRYLQVSQKGAVKLLEPAPLGLRQWGALAAHRVGERIAALLPPEEAGLLSALLTGDRTRYSRAFNAALSNSGAAHITSVSGLHISVLVSFLVVFLGRKAGLYAALPVIFAYAAIAGFAPSAMRAVIMCAFSVFAFAGRREHDTLTALFAALLILVAANPFAIVSASLVLSFSSTLGILLFTPMVLGGLRRLLPRGRGLWGRGLDSVCQAAAASVGAMAFTLPLCLLFFSRVSLVSALATLLVLLPVSAAMILGMLVLGLSLISLPAAAFLAAWVLRWPLAYMVRIIMGLGGQRWVAASDSVYFVLATLTLAVVLVAARKKWLRGGVAFGAAVAAFCAFFILTAAENRLYSEMVVHASGNSAMVLLRTGDRAAAVNLGGVDRGRSAMFVDDTLAAWGIAQLDLVVLTSGSYRDTGGLEQALARVDMGRVYLPAEDGVPAPSGSAPVVRYEGGGALSWGAFSIELYRAAGENYIARVAGSGVSLVNLCGLHPFEALAALEAAPRGDILLVDRGCAAAPAAFQSLCRRLAPRLTYLCGDRYVSPRPLEGGAGGTVLHSALAGDLHIQFLNR